MTTDSSSNGQHAELDGLQKKAAGGFWALASSNLLLQLFSWVLTILTMRFLSPADYGVMAMAETVTPYFALIATLDLVNWGVQRRSLAEYEGRAVFTIGVTAGLLVCTAGLLIAPYLSSFYDRPDLLQVLRIIALSFFIRGFGILPEITMRREFRFKQLSWVNFFSGISRGILQCALAYAGFGYWALVLGFVAGDCLKVAMLLRYEGLKFRIHWDTALLRDALAFGVPAIGAALLWILFSSSDKIIVGRLFGVDTLGFYAMACYLVDLPLSRLSTALNSVLISYFSKLKEDPARLVTSFLQTVRGYSLVVFPAILGIGLVSDELVSVVFGEHWLALKGFLPVLALIGLVRALLTNLTPLFLALGKPSFGLYSNALGVLLFPATGFLLASTFGMNGLYLTWFVNMPIIVICNLYLLKQVTGITAAQYFAMMGPAATGLAVMAGTLYGLSQFADLPPPIVMLIAKMVVGAGVYYAIAWYFFREQTLKICLSLGLLEQ